MIHAQDNAQAEIDRLKDRVTMLERELARYRQAAGEAGVQEIEPLLSPEDVPNFVGLLKPNGEVERVNRQLWEFFGGTEDTIRDWGKHPEIHHPDDRERIVAEFNQGVGSGEPFVCTYRGRRHDGVYRWLECEQKPLRDEEGRIYRWCVIMRDIDDLVRAAEALRESERDARAVVDGIPGLTGMLGPDGSVQLVNRRILEYTGQTLTELQNWGTNGTVHAEDLPHVADVFGRSIATGVPYYIEQRLRRFDGEYRWFANSGIPARDEAGNILRWYILLTDIHEKKKAEDALRARENDLRLIINTIPGLICLFTPEGELEGANEQFLDYIQGPVEAAKNWATNGVVHPDDVSTAAVPFAHSLATGEPYDFEIRIRRADGMYRWFKIRGRPHCDGQGRIVRWYGLLTDIHDRKLAEDELRRREYYLAMGERVSETGSYVWEVSTDRITCSEQLLRIHEFDDRNTVTAAAMRDRIHPEDLQILESTKAEVESGRGNEDYEIRLRMPDGRVKYVRAFSEVIHDANGQMICIGAVQDVTRRRLAEEALDKVRSDLTHLSRVMSLGTLTASIAHEVNQPLAGIMTNSNICVRMLTADPPNVTGALETVRRTIRDSNRAADVVARLRALFSGRTAKSAGVDLNEAAAEILTLMASDLQRSRVQVQTEFAADLPRITADRVQLQQVILNLLRNASDAMSNVEDRQRLAIIETKRGSDGAVTLSVQDCGVGFPTENAEKMFQAFYSTKNDGMGMGLSVSRSIIESHYGRIWAESRDGGGAMFAFSVPIEGVRT